MSRQFDVIAGTHSITFSPGNSPTKQGPITVAVLAKAANAGGFVGWMARGLNSGTAEWGFLTASANLFSENDFGTGVSGLSTSWRWYVLTKPSGSSLPRIHVWDLSGAWAHTNDSSNVGDTTGPIDTVVVGGNGGTSNGWRGSIAVVATWDTVLSDGQIQTACSLSAADTFAASPRWMVRLNQASTGTSVTDDTGGGGNQTAIAGTSVDADDPPGYSYSLAAQTFPAGISIPVTLGQPTVAMTVTPSGISVPVTVGTPSVTFSARVDGGSWWQLDSVRKQNRDNARMERQAGPLACPNDGEPLLYDPRTMRRRCPYDGWISPVK